MAFDFAAQAFACAVSAHFAVDAESAGFDLFAGVFAGLTIWLALDLFLDAAKDEDEKRRP